MAESAVVVCVHGRFSRRISAAPPTADSDRGRGGLVIDDGTMRGFRGAMACLAVDEGAPRAGGWHREQGGDGMFCDNRTGHFCSGARPTAQIRACAPCGFVPGGMQLMRSSFAECTSLSVGSDHGRGSLVIDDGTTR